MRQRNLGYGMDITSANGAGNTNRTKMTSNDSGGRAAIGVRSADGGASTLT